VAAQNSLAADLYPGRRLPMALALISAGSAIGVAFSLFVGGLLLETFNWRTVFLIVGAPGLLLALFLFFAIREPPRRTLRGDRTAEDRPPLMVVARYLWSLRTYRAILLAALLSSMSGSSLNAWGPSFLIRVHGLSPSQVGLWFGLATALGLGAGLLAAGQMSTILGARDIRWHLRIGGTFSLLCAPAGIWCAYAPSPILAVACIFLFQFCTAVHVPPEATLVQSLAHPRMRGMAAAGAAFAQTLGAGLGPLIMGMLSDLYATTHGVDGIRLSLATIMISVAVAGGIYLLANRWAPAEYARTVREAT
jgi:MFS family permease